MLKKLIVVGVVGAVAFSAIKGSKVGSYIRSEISDLRERAEAKIPPEREIARLRHEVKNLDKDIGTIIAQLARERVEVAQLEKKTKDLRVAQVAAKETLELRATEIENANERVTFNGATITVAQAKVELEDGVKRYTANQKSLEGMEAALVSRERVKGGLEKQLDAMKNQKAELTASIDALEAELTALKLRQMESKYQTDDTRLAKIKEGINELKTKLEVEREKLNLTQTVFEPAPVKAVSGKSVKDIMAPLNGQTKPADVKVPQAD